MNHVNRKEKKNFTFSISLIMSIFQATVLLELANVDGWGAIGAAGVGAIFGIASILIVITLFLFGLRRREKYITLGLISVVVSSISAFSFFT
ncbi:hypothetical protein M0C34_16380 [Agarivorans sp. TSD2052]|uniref:hypothetical protein n=1 Tax=Agarivorans sp. TSD2052 TaxID=2937286 RepID=UPI00200FDCF1|nr:hypothetical protein [Agarivorans sp. TSD2052]UPW17794.1 hypothetical protein M0C34_16380 [Agarivorans sp. TSD2052]